MIPTLYDENLKALTKESSRQNLLMAAGDVRSLTYLFCVKNSLVASPRTELLKELSYRLWAVMGVLVTDFPLRKRQRSYIATRIFI